MSGDPVEQEGVLRLDPDSIEALAVRLAELLTPAEEAPPRRFLISAEEVARWWGVGRRWVYDHADELGAKRIGAGRRPRLRFDPKEVAEHLGDLPGDGDARGLPPMRADCRSDSLPRRSGAKVAGQTRKRPGRRMNAPRPGAGLAAQ